MHEVAMFTNSAYFDAAKRTPGFDLHRVQSEAYYLPQYKQNDLSYNEFCSAYKSERVVARKFAAIPQALYTFIFKTIYHIAAAVFCSIRDRHRPESKWAKAHSYNARRTYEKSWGYFVTLFNERLGAYYVQRSQFHSECYDLMHKKPPQMWEYQPKKTDSKAPDPWPIQPKPQDPLVPTPQDNKASTPTVPVTTPDDKTQPKVPPVTTTPNDKEQPKVPPVATTPDDNTKPKVPPVTTTPYDKLTPPPIPPITTSPDDKLPPPLPPVTTSPDDKVPPLPLPAVTTNPADEPPPLPPKNPKTRPADAVPHPQPIVTIDPPSTNETNTTHGPHVAFSRTNQTIPMSPRPSDEDEYDDELLVEAITNGQILDREQYKKVVQQIGKEKLIKWIEENNEKLSKMYLCDLHENRFPISTLRFNLMTDEELKALKIRDLQNISLNACLYIQNRMHNILDKSAPSKSNAPLSESEVLNLTLLQMRELGFGDLNRCIKWIPDALCAILTEKQLALLNYSSISTLKAQSMFSANDDLIIFKILALKRNQLSALLNKLDPSFVQKLQEYDELKYKILDDQKLGQITLSEFSKISDDQAKQVNERLTGIVESTIGSDNQTLLLQAAPSNEEETERLTLIQFRSLIPKTLNACVQWLPSSAFQLLSLDQLKALDVTKMSIDQIKTICLDFDQSIGAADRITLFTPQQKNDLVIKLKEDKGLLNVFASLIKKEDCRLFATANRDHLIEKSPDFRKTYLSEMNLNDAFERLYKEGYDHPYQFKFIPYFLALDSIVKKSKETKLSPTVTTSEIITSIENKSIKLAHLRTIEISRLNECIKENTKPEIFMLLSDEQLNHLDLKKLSNDQVVYAFFGFSNPLDSDEENRKNGIESVRRYGILLPEQLSNLIMRIKDYTIIYDLAPHVTDEKKTTLTPEALGVLERRLKTLREKAQKNASAAPVTAS